MNIYTGACHCGKVRFEVEMDDPKAGITCNCSYCSKKGTVLTFVPAEHLKITQGEDDLTHYHFNKKIVDHSFCATCGTQAFGKGKGPDGVEMAAINLRCVDTIDLHALDISEFNGKDI